MAALIPPAAPYCSLTDAHMQNHFTKDRIKQHLRRAGLVNKNGYIVTETEYENRLGDIEIGRQNRRKYDEALLEVLIQLGEEQYKLLCQEMEKIKKELQYQFRRIENKYARRVHPVKIRVTHDGHIKTAMDVEQPLDNQTQRDIVDVTFPPTSHLPKIQERNRLDEIQKKLDEFIDKMNTLAKMNANNIFLLNMPETIRQLKEKQEEYRKQHESWKKDYEEREIKRIRETKREFELFREQIENSTIDKRQIEQLIRTSSIIKELRESVSRIRLLVDDIPVGLTQAAVDAVIATNKKETMQRESIIEQSVGDAGEQVKKLESRLNELSTKPPSLSETISRAEVDKLIRQAIQNIKPTEQNDNSESRKLIREMNDRLSQLQKQFDQLPQFTNVDNTRIEDNYPRDQTTVKNEPSSRKSSPSRLDHRKQQYKTPSNPYPQVPDLRSIDQRIAQLEDRLNTTTDNERKASDPLRNVPIAENALQTQLIVPIPNLQNPANQHPGSDEKLGGNKKPLAGEKANQTAAPPPIHTRKEKSKGQKNKPSEAADPEFHDDRVSDLQGKLSNYSVTIQNLQDRINDLVKSGEQQNEKLNNDLGKRVSKNEADLSKTNVDLATLRRQLVQQPTSTSVPSTNKDPPARTYTEEEFQAIMPFMELLPTFDALVENEWDGIH